MKGGVKMNPQKKLPLKHPALLGLNGTDGNVKQF